jgi:hypothetical protein
VVVVCSINLVDGGELDIYMRFNSGFVKATFPVLTSPRSSFTASELLGEVKLLRHDIPELK